MPCDCSAITSRSLCSGRARATTATDAAKFAELPGVSTARLENGGVSLATRELHVTLPAVLAAWRAAQTAGVAEAPQ